MRRKMELGIIPLNRMQELINDDIGIQLLMDLTYQSIFGSLTWLNFSARELPPILEIPITALGSKDFISFTYYGSNNFYPFHTHLKDF